MIRALLKGSGLAIFGMTKTGERLYRHTTRNILDTQRSHIIKLHRVWPGTFKQIEKVYGRSFNHKKIYIHEVGWTPFWPCVNYLLTGSGGVLVNTDLMGSSLLMRHLVFAINQVLDLLDDMPQGTKVPKKRVDDLDALRWCGSLQDFLYHTNSEYIEACEPGTIPMQNESADIIYSGGQLEHYPPEVLSAWLDEAYRILRPGGLLAPVFDHRDHLYHFDHSIPFLNHYRFPDVVYRTSHKSRLLYHNRMLPEEVADLFEKKGFTKRRVLRLILPDNRWVEHVDHQAKLGLDRRLLAKRFAGISDDDLSTAAGHYIFEKP